MPDVKVLIKVVLPPAQDAAGKLRWLASDGVDGGLDPLAPRLAAPSADLERISEVGGHASGLAGLGTISMKTFPAR